MASSDFDTFGLHVLCIDDSKSQLALYRDQLEGMYTVTGAETYEEAVACLSASHPDLIILDMNMPRVTGLEFLDILRFTPNYSRIPVIIVSGDNEPKDIKEAFRRGAADYVRKPYRLAEVLKRIEKLVVKEAAVQCFEIGNLRFYPDQHKLVVDGEELYLNNYASEVLMLLCKNKDNFVSRDTIIETVWKTRDTRLKEGSLNNNVTVLRKYLERDPSLTLESKIKLGLRLRTE